MESKHIRHGANNYREVVAHPRYIICGCTFVGRSLPLDGGLEKASVLAAIFTA
jgi:hypothetical protein